jgi:hypothetical protein
MRISTGRIILTLMCMSFVVAVGLAYVVVTTVAAAMVSLGAAFDHILGAMIFVCGLGLILFVILMGSLMFTSPLVFIETLLWLLGLLDAVT